MTLKAWAAALALLWPAATHAQDWAPPVGHWSGTGIQGEDRWAIEVQIAYQGARVDYPGIPCGGIWVFEEGDQTVKGHEWLTYGHALCIDALRVSLTPLQDGGLDVRWLTSLGEEIASAILTRQQARPDHGKTGKKSAGGN